MTRPLLSIVIANYNYGRFLEDAIKSVIAQEVGDKVELIICDAASTDNSVEIIKKYADGLPPNTPYEEWLVQTNPELSTLNSQLITWWCSEKDGGQSAAFNKGFSHARGEWLTWLNADDFYLPGVLNHFIDVVIKHPGAEWITGNKVHFDSASGKIISVNWGPHCQPPFMRKNHAISAVFGPSSFFKKSLYERMGPIDEKLHYAMDSAYWARCTMAGVRQKRLNVLCWAFRNHEESKTAGVQADTTTKKRQAETNYWRNETGYSYKVSMSNPWYVLWLVWRIFDGSLFQRAMLKFSLEGKSIEHLIQIKKARP